MDSDPDLVATYVLQSTGDTGLAVFPAEPVDEGVRAFQTVQEVGESWLGERGFRSGVTVRMDVGPEVFRRLRS